jgi:hypothetical protein
MIHPDIRNSLLFSIPIKNHKNFYHKDNVIYLVYPSNNLFELFVAWLTQKPSIKDIRLNKLSSRIWRYIDGKNNVHKIGQLL